MQKLVRWCHSPRGPAPHGCSRPSPKPREGAGQAPHLLQNDLPKHLQSVSPEKPVNPMA